jgi:hypothetical protein
LKAFSFSSGHINPICKLYFHPALKCTAENGDGGSEQSHGGVGRGNLIIVQHPLFQTDIGSLEKAQIYRHLIHHHFIDLLKTDSIIHKGERILSTYGRGSSMHTGEDPLCAWKRILCSYRRGSSTHL